MKVSTSASKSEIVPYGEGLKAYVRSAPEKGRANKELLEILADRYNVTGDKIRIISGETSPNKYVEVDI